MSTDDRTTEPSSRPPAADHAPVPHYEIRVGGHLGVAVGGLVRRLTLTNEDDGTTVIRGPVVDQAALHGLLQKLRDLGITLLSLTPLAPDTATEHPTDPQPHPPPPTRSNLMITVTGLTKHYGDRTAVDDLTFTVAAGRVTGFVGPNGAGKSTTMRMMVGLTRPDAGEVRYDGVRYTDLRHPARLVGAVLDPRCMHPGHTARNHLRAMAAVSGIPAARVDEVLAEVGLESAADQRTGGFSLGMRQRLALAGALLGDPQVLLLDEPSNGLDPDGIRWLRNHLTDFARRGGTVFVSSHLISELACSPTTSSSSAAASSWPPRPSRRSPPARPRPSSSRRPQPAELARVAGRPGRHRRGRRRPPGRPRHHQGRRVPARLRARHPPRRAQRDRAVARGQPARHDRRLRRVRLRLTTRPHPPTHTTTNRRTPNHDHHQPHHRQPDHPWTTTDRTAVRTAADDVRAVPAALRSEWIKLTTLRANKVILALTAVDRRRHRRGLAATATDPTLTASELFIYPLPLVAMLATVTGILMFTGEAQHGTLAVTLDRPPRPLGHRRRQDDHRGGGRAGPRRHRRWSPGSPAPRSAASTLGSGSHLASPGAVGAALHRPRRRSSGSASA